MTIGQRLRKARERKGWSQTFVCEKLKISNSRLSGYERDYREPDAEMLSTLAQLYEVTVDWIVGRTDNPKGIIRDDGTETDVYKWFKEQLESGEPKKWNGKPMTESKKRQVLKILEALDDD